MLRFMVAFICTRVLISVKVATAVKFRMQTYLLVSGTFLPMSGFESDLCYILECPIPPNRMATSSKLQFHFSHLFQYINFTGRFSHWELVRFNGIIEKWAVGRFHVHLKGNEQSIPSCCQGRGKLSFTLTDQDDVPAICFIMPYEIR